MMHRIKIAGGSVLIAASLCLSAACSMEKHSAKAETGPQLSPVAKQAPTQAMAQTAGQASDATMPRISGQEALAMVKAGKAVILDVRSVEAYKMEHPKGALSLPLQKIEQGDYKAMTEDGKFQELPRDKRIISSCSCPAENSSARAALVLHQANFKDASALLGGPQAWEAAGGEMVRGTPPQAGSPNQR